LDGFSELKSELAENGIDVVAASSDEQEKARESAGKYNFPVGFGVDQALIESVGGTWQAERKFGQPSEFVLAPGGKIAMVSYSDGPLARLEAGDVIKMVNFLKSK
jgi:peroxiredoxin